MKYFKFLTKDNCGEHSRFDFTDYLPEDDEPGTWLPEVEHLEMCESGYHAFTADDLIHWINHDLYEVELGGNILEGDNKVAANKMRFIRKVDAWNDKTARLYACWCVRQVWHLLEDGRSKEAVRTAERYANGEVTKKELDAAWASARAAARAAAGDAARAAARDAAWDATRAAARDAAWAAARAAAGDAAWAAARDAQTKQLKHMLGL